MSFGLSQLAATRWKAQGLMWTDNEWNSICSANIFKGKLYGSVKEIFVNALKSENSSCLAMQIVSHDDSFL